MTIEEKAYNKAVEVIRACVKPQGFYASGLRGGYGAVWSRDSMITALGASLVEREFKKPIRDSLNLLAKHQTKNGHIPNCVGSYNIERRNDVTFNSIDAPLWFIIGHYVYASAYNDHALLERHKKYIAKAIVWLRYQDPNEDKLIVQQPTNDWMDAFPHKYGRVTHTLALYFSALKMIGKTEEAKHIRRVLNGEIEQYLSLWDNKLGFYRPWAWKDHAGIKETEDWFDTLANLLTIITSLATHGKAEKIIKHIGKKAIDRPYPCKAIWPPIKKGDKEWRDYYAQCDARTPLHYLNAGIWPMIGGFYVAALVKLKKWKDAKIELKRLAEANMKKLKIRKFKEGYEFNEWLDGAHGNPKGEPYQAWSASTYIYAYECLKQKKVLFF
ncbi:MAG: amylo-alpha-1,6-glucosidase [Patescibacteria group bacterium]|nr:amylo-alpha-1,6-glucosidase [Patescibacteria group bacterium]